jgi:hypothetical protein
MRPTTLRTAAAFAAAVIGFGSIASAQQPQQQSSPDNKQPQQQLEETKRQEKTEMRRQGDRKVEVREMALWSLGELPPHLMHKAMEHLADEPAEARRAVMQAANIIELQASLAIQKAEAQAVQQQRQSDAQARDAGGVGRTASGDDRISSRDSASSSSSSSSANASRDKGIGAYQASTGGDWSNTRDQGLWRAAEDLRELAMKIEYKQVLTKDELREPFARAATSMAAFYQKAAESGLQRQDEEQTGYALKGAAEYLAAAHAFGQRRPTPETSRAIFDGERLANQIVKLSKPTTLQKDQKNDTARTADASGDLNDAARTAGGRQPNAQSIPQEAGQVISNLGDAIRQAETRQGATGQDAGRQRDRQNDQSQRQDEERR